ncbi:MAG: peptidoglycan editing factor PgeF [Rhizobacter sp.]|jgi:YfiH family protein
MHPDWLRPDWRVDGVGGLMSTRAGGQSTPPFDRLNLGTGVGDDPAVVARNRAIFRAATAGAAPVFLKQVHGTRVVRLAHSHAASDATPEEADASVTTEPGLACTVLVADCLPVLFAAPDGRAVGAAHAGWRGLKAGVLEATLREVCAAGVCAPEEVAVWLGACIGPRRFEVGPDVLEAFGAAADTAVAACFAPLRPGKWLADLPRLARGRLLAAGVSQVSGGDWCTVEDASRFFSFRRDGVTGRMAAAVWITRSGG